MSISAQEPIWNGDDGGADAVRVYRDLRDAVDVSEQDPERGKSEADDVIYDFLCGLGYQLIAEEWKKVGGWRY